MTDEDEDFELLGLRGDLELLLDPADAGPRWNCAATSKIAGQVTVHLRRAVLRS